MFKFQRYNGKCKKCKKGFSVVARDLNQLINLPSAVVFRNCIESSLFVFETEENELLLGPSQGSIARICDCGSHVELLGVQGKYRAAVKCDARCEGATGRNCECQCGGKNHGAGHGYFS